MAVHTSDPQTELLVLGLGEAIVTTCGQARMFLEQGTSFQGLAVDELHEGNRPMDLETMLPGPAA